MEQLHCHIFWEALPNIWGNAKIFSPYMRRPLVIYDFATAQFLNFLLHIWGKCDSLFYQWGAEERWLDMGCPLGPPKGSCGKHRVACATRMKVRIIIWNCVVNIVVWILLMIIKTWIGFDCWIHLLRISHAIETRVRNPIVFNFIFPRQELG